jgi:hypothetical protein
MSIGEVQVTEWVLDRSRGCTPAGTTGKERPLITEQLVVLAVGEEHAGSDRPGAPLGCTPCWQADVGEGG